MSTFSPDWAYETEHPYAQYFNGYTYPGNSIMATVGQNVSGLHEQAARSLQGCPGIYVTGAAVGTIIISMYAYITHRKLIKQKKMKAKDLWMYALMGATATPAIMWLTLTLYANKHLVNL